jgi:hypothetical protein
MNRRFYTSHKLALLTGAGVLALGLGGQSAQAQLFCPSGGTFSNGSCVNAAGTEGAVSTAALSSQALSDASQNVTQVSNDQSTSAVRRRLEQERAPQTAAAPAAAPSSSRPAPRRRAAAPVSRDLKDGPMVVKAPPVVSYGPTFAVWSHAYGDYEKWNADTTGIRRPGGALLLLANNDPTSISIERRTTTFGVLGGADWTFNSATSTWVMGILAGYMDSTVKFHSTSAGTAAGIATGNSTISDVKADITGPSIGGYVTFATGPWSFDVTGRVDFLSIDQSFNELLFANTAAAVNTSGSASTDVNNYSITANGAYRIPSSASTWWEPTAGFRYTRSDYDNSAAVLGMADGEVWRVQGGVRFGADTYWGGTQVVATLTGLVYSDVSISGLVLNSGTFGGAVVPDDEGKVRGMGILGLNFIYSPAITTYVNAEVRGGDDYFGVGGRVGLRVGLN